MKIDIVKEHRKTIVLKLIDSENAVVKVPTRMSDKKIKDFLDSKMSWLEKNAKKLAENEDLASSFNFNEFIYLDGMQKMSIEDVILNTGKMSDSQKRKVVKKYYLSQFNQLEEIVHEVSEKTGLKYKEIKPVNSVRVWGSYNINGIMKLNWKLLILPRRLAYYVVCHELCHSLHMNHKPSFWRDVESICPNYKVLRKELSKYGFILKNEI